MTDEIDWTQLSPPAEQAWIDELQAEVDRVLMMLGYPGRQEDSADD